MVSRPFVRARGPEFTNVGMETEVTIPWATYKKLLILGSVSIWCFWAFGQVLWMGSIAARGEMSLWRWASRLWWPWMGRWWWIPIALCLAWWGSAPTWVTIYRYWIEQKYKRTPECLPWNPENGPWSPSAHRQLEAVAPPQQVEAETVDVNLVTQPKGRKRPQNKMLPKFPNSKRERAFYESVGAGGAFSEGGAAKDRVSQRQFRKIRDALMDRGLAKWKNERRHKDGIDLSSDGRRFLGARGR